LVQKYKFASRILQNRAILLSIEKYESNFLKNRDTKSVLESFNPLEIQEEHQVNFMLMTYVGVINE